MENLTRITYLTEFDDSVFGMHYLWLNGKQHVCGYTLYSHPDYYKLVGLYVNPVYRGNGFSHMMLKECTELAKSEHKYIMLQVHKNNWVIDLYGKYNFIHIPQYDEENYIWMQC